MLPPGILLFTVPVRQASRNDYRNSVSGFASRRSSSRAAERHDTLGVTETQFHLPNTFSPQESTSLCLLRAIASKPRGR
jgi:predicted ABC-type transport system involved in lysophospholipase L1 biosynthesis ATPase subunit